MCVHLWLKFMGCCDSIPQICFKVAVTAFVENKLKQGVCVCAFMGCCDSIPQICFKVAWTIFFQNKLKQGVCVYSWVAVTAPLNVKALKCSFCFWVRVVQQQHYLKHV